MNQRVSDVVLEKSYSGTILCRRPICVFKLFFIAKCRPHTWQTNFLGTPHSYVKCRLRLPLLLYLREQPLGQYQTSFSFVVRSVGNVYMLLNKPAKKKEKVRAYT